MAEGLFGSDSRLSFLFDEESFLVEFSFQGLESLSISSSTLLFLNELLLQRLHFCSTSLRKGL